MNRTFEQIKMAKIAHQRTLKSSPKFSPAYMYAKMMIERANISLKMNDSGKAWRYFIGV